MEDIEIGTWQRIADLGSGAFGVVTLWKDKVSNECLAIKKCKWSKLTDKQKMRWENEVNIMKSIDNPNIVGFKPVPVVLERALMKSSVLKVPLLSMEYCTKGNLRHVLSQPSSSCGLPESDVRAILGDLANAVSHLHRLNITHRDIKPDNIVLQEDSTRKNGVIYKLIDLGYAKELNDSVVSFVGTLHYLAPEIIRGEKYNFSVDYWSFGILTFEIVCGILPFLPALTPIERFNYIEKKNLDHICIYQLYSGSVSYSTEMFKENHITSCLKQHIERWLKQVLAFDPALRSRKFPDNTEVFQHLQNILKKRIVQVFSVSTLEFYSYEISESTLIGTLKEWIARDVKVPAHKQILVSKKLKCAFDEEVVISTLDEDDALFVFKANSFINKQTCTYPKYVKIIFDSCTKKYKWRDLRPLYAKCLFFLVQEQLRTSSVCTSFQLLTSHLINLMRQLKLTCQLVNQMLRDLTLRVECYFNVHADLIRIGDRDNANFKNSVLHIKQLVTAVEKCISNVINLNKIYKSMEQRHSKLTKDCSRISNVSGICDIRKCVQDASMLLVSPFGSNKVADSEKLIRSVTNTKGDYNSVSCIEMCKIISKAIKEKDKLINEAQLSDFVRSETSLFRNASAIISWLEEFKAHIKDITTAFDEAVRKVHQSAYTPENSGVKSISLKGDDSGIESRIHQGAASLVNENRDLRYRLEEVFDKLSPKHKELGDSKHISVTTDV